MPQELEKRIENHLATFPERHEDFIEMKNEWNEYKRKAFWVLLGFSSSILAIGIWVGTMQTRLEGVVYEHTKLEQLYVRTDSRIGILEVTNGEIRARLSSIDLALQEIKVAIKNIPR